MLNGAAAVVGVASAAFFLPPNLDNNLFSPGVVVAVDRKVLAEALSRPVRAAALAVGASSSSLIKEEDEGAADAAVASLASPPSSHAGDSPSIASCTGVRRADEKNGQESRLISNARRAGHANVFK